MSVGINSGRRTAVTEKPGTGVSAPRPPRVRRRPVVLVSAIAAVVVGALGSLWLWTSMSSAVDVVALQTTVHRGEIIDREDLILVQVALDPALDAVRADGLDDVVGRRAATDLPAGGLLVAASISEQVVPQAGDALVGVGLSPAMMPAEPLVAGDRVRIVETPGALGEVTTAPVVMDAIVSRVTILDTGLTLVDVVVPEDRAAELAARAATGRVALVLSSRER